MLFGAAGAAEVVAVAVAAEFGVAAVVAEGAAVAARVGDGAAGAKFRNGRMNNKADEMGR